MPQQEERQPVVILTHAFQEPPRVADVAREAVDMAARTRRAAVAAQVVDLDGEAVRHKRRDKVAVAPTVLTISVRHGHDRDRVAVRQPALPEEPDAVGRDQQWGLVPHVPDSTSLAAATRPAAACATVLGVDRRRLKLWALAAVTVVTALFAAACTTPAPGAYSPSAGGASAAAGAPAGAAAQSDWRHTLQVVANVRADPPTVPVVYLLGGSVARECVPSEASWAAAVKAAGGPAALTYDLGSRNRTSAQDLKLVAQMPAIPTILLIGVNVGRFTQAPSTPTITLPEPTASTPPWDQHHYSTALSSAKKKSLVSQWMQRRYPLFKQHFSDDLGTLEKLVKAAKAKGFHPVLLDLPRNTAIIGSAMDAPVGRYHRACADLARKYAHPLGQLRRCGQAEERRLLRPVAPHQAGSRQVAAAARGEDRGPAREVRHGRSTDAVGLALSLALALSRPH